MEKKTIDDFIDQSDTIMDIHDVREAMVAFAQYHVKAALETIYNAGLDNITSWSGNPYTDKGSDSLDYDKLMNIYSEENIK